MSLAAQSDTLQIPVDITHSKHGQMRISMSYLTLVAVDLVSTVSMPRVRQMDMKQRTKSVPDAYSLQLS